MSYPPLLLKEQSEKLLTQWFAAELANRTDGCRHSPEGLSLLIKMAFELGQGSVIGKNTEIMSVRQQSLEATFRRYEAIRHAFVAKGTIPKELHAIIASNRSTDGNFDQLCESLYRLYNLEPR